jgi:hypothetical protein
MWLVGWAVVLAAIGSGGGGDQDPTWTEPVVVKVAASSNLPKSS